MTSKHISLDIVLIGRAYRITMLQKSFFIGNVLVVMGMKVISLGRHIGGSRCTEHYCNESCLFFEGTIPHKISWFCIKYRFCHLRISHG
jgi:hypothetical protein